MYILVDKDNVINHISATIGKQKETGYYLINNKTMAIPTEFISEVYEVAEIPKEVEEQKYCYTKEKGFYRNKNYKKHYTIEEQIASLQDMVNEIIMGGLEEDE